MISRVVVLEIELDHINWYLESLYDNNPVGLDTNTNMVITHTVWKVLGNIHETMIKSDEDVFDKNDNS